MCEPGKGWDGSVERRADATQPRKVQVVLGQYAPIFAGMIVSLFIVLGVLAYGIINTNQRARDVEQVNRRIAACVLDQLTEHRARSDFINRKVSDRLGLEYPETGPGIKPEALDPAVQRSCDEFIQDRNGEPR